MARIKYWNETSQAWEYADKSLQINNNNNILIDSTLSIEGRAADAKAVGDRITSLDMLVGDISIAEQINTALAESAILTPNTAKVNQILSVKSVDANGKPTEWETVDVPEGGGGTGGFSLPLLYETTTTEEARWIDTGDNAFEAKNMIIVELMSKATATNEADYNAAGSIYTENEKPIYPWSNYVLGAFNAIMNEFVAPMPKQYDTLLRCVGFRGNGGDWTVYYNCRNVVNDGASYARIKMPYRAGLRYPITGIIIGDQSAAAGTRVFGVGTTLKVWGC